MRYLFARVAMACGKTPSELLRTERLAVIVATAKQIHRYEDTYFLKLQAAMAGAYEPTYEEDEPQPQNEAERQWAETDARVRQGRGR